MEFGAERYYRNSGAAPIGGVLLSLVLGALTGALLGALHGLLDWYNPYIFLTFLGAIGAAMGIGFVVVFSLSLGKVRNRILGIGIGTISGLVAIYSAWVVFLFFWSREVFGQGTFLFRPDFLFLTMQSIAQIGLWEKMPKGRELYAIWLVEAANFIGGPTLMAYLRDSPFCERCDAWADKHAHGVGLQTPPDLNDLKRDLEDERYSRLYELMHDSRHPDNYLQLKVWMCPHCDDSTWLTVEHHVTTENAKGETKTSTTEIVKYLAIPRNLAEEFVSTFPNAGDDMEALLTDIPEGERAQPTSIPLAVDDGFEDSGDEDFWETKKT